MKSVGRPRRADDYFECCLIEKSPQYARGDIIRLRNNAIRMLESNPKMKLFVFISGLLTVRSFSFIVDYQKVWVIRYVSYGILVIRYDRSGPTNGQNKRMAKFEVNGQSRVTPRF